MVPLRVSYWPITLVLALLCLLICPFSAQAAEIDTNDITQTQNLPAEPLTDATFMPTLKSSSAQLHLVKFFSPFCPHCKQFSPVWDAVAARFADGTQRLPVALHSVDCVASGDLCIRVGQVETMPVVKLFRVNADGSDVEFVAEFDTQNGEASEAALMKFLVKQTGGDAEVTLGQNSEKAEKAEKAEKSATNGNSATGTADSKPELETEPPSLTSEDFDATIGVGMHIVKFYSPRCAHCRHLAPVWTEFYSTKHAQYEKRNVYLDSVDCLANRDLCSAHGIQFYPYIKVFIDGVWVDEFPPNKRDARNVAGLSEFVDKMVAQYEAEPGVFVVPEDGGKSGQNGKSGKNDKNGKKTEEAQSEAITTKAVKSAVSSVASVVESGAAVASASPSASPDSGEFKISADEPTELTAANFDAAISGSGFVAVKFYSPSCHHCRMFAPKWQIVFDTLVPKRDQLRLLVASVNCDVDRRLCDREGVDSVPLVRLYAAKEVEYVIREEAELQKNADGGVNSRKSSYTYLDYDGEMDAHPVLRFITQAMRVYRAATDLFELQGSAESEQIGETLLARIAAGAEEEPWIVMFWNREDSEDGKDGGKEDGKDDGKEDGDGKDGGKDNAVTTAKFEAKHCLGCLEVFADWSRFTRELPTATKRPVRVGHVNCLSHKEMCNRLVGFEARAARGMAAVEDPVIFVFTGGVKTAYRGAIASEPLVKLGQRVADNWYVPELPASAVADLWPNGSELPDIRTYLRESQTWYIFHYDTDTVTSEDVAVLPWLFQETLTLPGDIRLFRSSDMALPKTLQSAYRDTAANLGIELPTALIQHKERGTLPTLYCVTSGAAGYAKFPSTGPRDIRDRYRLYDWMDRTHNALVAELTPETAYSFFAQHPGDTRVAELTVVVIGAGGAVGGAAGGAGIADTPEAMAAIQTVANKYELLREQERLAALTELREAKDQRVAVAQSRGKSETAIMALKRRKVSVDEFAHRVQFVYLDATEHGNWVRYNGWDTSGGVVVVGRFGDRNWRSGADGKPLELSEASLLPFLEVMGGVKEDAEAQAAIMRGQRRQPIVFGYDMLASESGWRSVAQWVAFIVCVVICGIVAFKSGLWRKIRRGASGAGGAAYGLLPYHQNGLGGRADLNGEKVD